MKKLKTGHYLIVAFIALMGLLVLTNTMNKEQNRALQENGTEAIATIIDLEVNNYKANELEGRFIENYVFTYRFTDDDGKVITSVRTIEKKDFEQYFSQSKKINDQVTIMYDPDNPGKNAIKKIQAN